MLIVKRQGVYFPGKVYGVYSNYIALGSINFIFCITKLRKECNLLEMSVG